MTPPEHDPAKKDAAAPAIQAVQRAAVVMSSFTVTRPHLSLSEITAALGTSKATAHRYTKALRGTNLLRYDDRTSLYSLGPQLLTLASAARAGLPIIAAAEPEMEALLRRVNATVVLGVWDGETATVLRSLDNTDNIIQISVQTGARLDPLTSAQGRVFCAHLPADDIPGLARAMKRMPELADELATIREDGIAFNTPDINGVRTIAAPVLQGGAIVATLAIVGTTASVSDDAASPMAQALRETARTLSQRLGNADQ